MQHSSQYNARASTVSELGKYKSRKSISQCSAKANIMSELGEYRSRKNISFGRVPDIECQIWESIIFVRQLDLEKHQSWDELELLVEY